MYKKSDFKIYFNTKSLKCTVIYWCMKHFLTVVDATYYLNKSYKTEHYSDLSLYENNVDVYKFMHLSRMWVIN